METKITNKVLWIKVWGIAAVQGSITLTWVIYNLYFPLLLVELGFKKELAIAILIIENILASFIEPIFGWFSDRQQRLVGSKVPLISWGIMLASGLFIILPCLVIFNSEQFSWQWLLPIAAIIWAGAMAIFRAPTMTLLGRCATNDALPQAASILTLVGGIIGAFRFDAYGLILNMGAGFAFTLGSFSLLIAALILRRLNPVDLSPQSQTASVARPISLLLLSLIFATGIWVSWSIRFIMPAMGEILKLQFGADNGKLAMTIYFILLGLAALPAGKIATKWNNYRTMQWGTVGTIMALILLIVLPNILLPIALLIISFSLVLNGIIPLILNMVPQARAGLGTGIYFAGFGIGISNFSFIFTRLKISNLSLNITGAIACLFILCCWLIILEKTNKQIAL